MTKQTTKTKNKEEENKQTKKKERKKKERKRKKKRSQNIFFYSQITHIYTGNSPLLCIDHSTKRAKQLFNQSQKYLGHQSKEVFLLVTKPHKTIRSRVSIFQEFFRGSRGDPEAAPIHLNVKVADAALGKYVGGQTKKFLLLSLIHI